MISPDDRFDTFIEEIQIVNSRGMQQVDNSQQKYTGAIPKNSSPPSALMQPKAEHLPKKFQTLVELINSGVRVCVIMRGLPGSGKSYLAYQIIEATVKNPELHIFSADKFFTNSRGQYKFDPDKLQQAHEFAQRQFTQKACQGTSPLIVDNTNMTYWEMYYYLQVAVQYSYHIEILEPETPWKFAEGKLASKNQHSVPFEKIKMMKQKYETGVSLDQLLASINLQRVRNPLMRKIPPLQSAVPEVVSQVVVKQPVMKDLIAFDEEPMQRQQTDSPSKNSKDTTAPPPNRWRTPSPVFEDTWDGSGDKVDAPNEKSSPKNEPQPPKKNRKNKNRSPPAKFSPHRKSCPNENARFSQIRDLYPNVKDSCLWDFFVRCDGDADYCVNLLMDENLADQMEAGCELTCACFGADVTKAVVKEPIKPKPQSPTAKPKKSKQEVKQINLNEYLEAKQVIERGITIAPEHYPEHVKMVKQWKNGPTLPSEETTFDNTMDNTSESNSPEISEELHALPIANDLILELDDQYGGGLLKHIMEGADSHKFPSKIFIRKSTAHQLYIEIMEAYYSQAEEEKIHNMKKDEELAKKLNDEEVARGTKSFKKNGLKDHIEFITNEVQNTWINEESEGDMALRMSKEKLVQMFPQLNKNDLLEIFAGTNYNFNDTVATIQDSLSCTKEERAQMAQKQKQLFNTPWKDPNTERHDAHQSEDLDESSSEQYRTLENLRQEMKDRKEEQKVCLNKAREAIQKKSYELATYYSNIAQFHKQKHEEASHEAANMTASIHEQRQQTSTTLDLHYFSQIEASMVLDTYLDHWISRLRTIKKPYEELFLITGRGKNSINGIAAVKNKTKSRLRERTLNCTEENPGLLKVKVYPQSLLSNEFQ